MSSSGDDREQTMHSGATERNGPSLGTDLGSEQGDRILTRNETVAPTEEGKEATTQGTTVVREGDQHLDPTLASLFTGMEQDEIIGFITSVYISYNICIYIYIYPSLMIRSKRYRRHPIK